MPIESYESAYNFLIGAVRQLAKQMRQPDIYRDTNFAAQLEHAIESAARYGHLAMRISAAENK